MDDIRTDRLRWRLPRPDDFDAYLQLVSDFEVVKWTASWPHPPDPELVRQRCTPVSPERGFAGLIWRGRELVGAMGLIDGEIGFAFARTHWNKGFATEMGRAMIARAFLRHDWEAIEAGVFEGNGASRRVLEKLGFVATGQGQHECVAQGRSLPIGHFRLSRTAWLAANPLRIETDRLVIRPLTGADASAFHRIANHRRVARMMMALPHPLSEAAAAQWIAERAWSGGLGFCAGIFLKEGPLIGNVGLGGTPVSTMYFIDPEHWGRGYATEAMRAFLADSFARFALPEITAGAMADNPASQRVLEKLGFERTGAGRCTSMARLEDVPEYLYRLTRANQRP